MELFLIWENFFISLAYDLNSFLFLVFFFSIISVCFFTFLLISYQVFLFTPSDVELLCLAASILHLLLIYFPYLEENYSIDNILSDEARKTLLRNALKSFAEEIDLWAAKCEQQNWLLKYVDIQLVSSKKPSN